MTLTIQDLGALGEFFGSIAVLVTLIYLAFQTRQNRIAIGAIGEIVGAAGVIATSGHNGEFCPSIKSSSGSWENHSTA